MSRPPSACSFRGDYSILLWSTCKIECLQYLRTENWRFIVLFLWYLISDSPWDHLAVAEACFLLNVPQFCFFLDTQITCHSHCLWLNSNQRFASHHNKLTFKAWPVKNHPHIIFSAFFPFQLTGLKTSCQWHSEGRFYSPQKPIDDIFEPVDKFLAVWGLLWWEYLHQRNQQILHIRALFSFLHFGRLFTSIWLPLEWFCNPQTKVDRAKI